MMKRICSLLLAVVCISVLLLPVNAEQTDPLEKAFQKALGMLNTGYYDGWDGNDYFDEYIAHTVERVVFADKEDYEPVIISAEEYEAIVHSYFVIDDAMLQKVREYNERCGHYNPEDDTYEVHRGGFGGSLSAREYLAYVDNGDTYDVYYAHVTYKFLSDVLPEGVDEYQYAEELGWPMYIEYDGITYGNGPDGYYIIASYDDYGKKCTVEFNEDVVRLISYTDYTAADLPNGHIHYHFRQDTVAPSCIGEGYQIHTCSCGDSYRSDFVDALGHQYADGKCSVCGVKLARGDASGDGAINNVDAMLVLQHAVGINNGNAPALTACDVNADGTVNNVDAMLILQYAVGLITRFPCEV